jgi:hypothetical protein
MPLSRFVPHDLSYGLSQSLTIQIRCVLRYHHCLHTDIRAENLELRTRFTHLKSQVGRLVEQLQPLRESQSSAAANCSGSTANELYQHRHKQARVGDSRTSPLHKDEVLDTVFSFVGLGDYFYTGAVCSTWRKRYLKLCYSAAANRSKSTVVPRRRVPKGTTAAVVYKEPKCITFYGSAIMTAARLHMALKDSVTVAALQSQKGRLARDIVYYSLDPIGVLTLLKLHNLVWYNELCTYAAYKGRLRLLQWLHDCGCPWDEQLACKYAANSGRLDMLRWLYEVTGPWSDDINSYLMFTAGWCNSLDILEWLRAHDISWSKQLYGTTEYPSKPCEVSWSAEAAEWALANGCTWGEWQCQQLQAARYTEDDYKEQALELFAWAHKNGCPHVHVKLLQQQQQQQQTPHSNSSRAAAAATVSADKQ